jgi:hypothetical protein
MLTVFLANSYLCLGDRERARELRDRAVAGVAAMIPGRPDHDHQRAIVHGFAGRLALEDGDLDAACELLRDAYEASIAATDLPIAGRVGEGTVLLALQLGHPAEAAEMLGASMRLRGTEDRANPQTAAVLDALYDGLGEEATEAAVAAGRAMDRDAALARLDPARVLDALAVGAQGERDEDGEQTHHPAQRPPHV